MFTLCPHCDTVHRVDAAALSQANGRVRCGGCGKAFNSLRHLFDDFPNRASDARRPAYSTSAPLLRVETNESGPPEDAQEAEPRAWWSRWSRHGWWALVAVLCLATVLNTAWLFRERISPDSAVGGWLHGIGVSGFEPPGEFRDPSLFHLVARDIHTHPTRPGVLVLSATFVNLAERAQPYPTVAVTLLDPDSRPLVVRSFPPEDYLAVDTDTPKLTPNQHVPILLEFQDPGEKAVGFELAFR